MANDVTITDYRALAEFRYQIRRYLAFGDEAAEAAGLRPRQYQLLLALKGLPDGTEATITNLAERLGIRHHSTVELVDRLERRGLVERERSDVHRSFVFVRITKTGEAMLRMTPLTDSLGAALSISPRSLVIPPDSNLAWLIRRDPRGEVLRHPNGCRKITGLRVIAPDRGLNEATARLDRWNVAKFARGDAWCVELTLDRARLGKTADLRPALPLVLKY